MLGSFRFDRFSLDPGNRQLRRDDAPVELNSRYLDALALLVREHGKLVSKERFLAEVWRGAPVTDGSLTGAGVGFGVAAAGFASKHFSQWSLIGGAAGGLIVGAVVKLIGLDAFTLFLGQSPGDITGAAEGALLGGAIGFGLWLGSRTGVRVLRRSVIAGGIAGAAAGVLV